MTGHLSPAAARRAFLLLTGTRWFPVGLVVGILMLLPLERGLTAGQAVTALGVIGLVVFALELPTSGFADAFGRKPVLVAAGLFNLASAAVFLLAETFWQFVVASVLMGVYRALDSGPLEAWYVDTVHLTDPDAEVDDAMAAHGIVTGIGIATGALISGWLVWWHPWTSASALLLPFLIWAALGVLHLLAVVVLMKEPRGDLGSRAVTRAMESVRTAPAVVRDGVGLVRRNAALRGVVLVTAFMAVAMVVFESFTPVRLADLLGDEAAAGIWMGPVAAAGWAAFAAGSALAGRLSRRLGAARTAMAAHTVTAVGALTMGLVAGPELLVVAHLVTYGLFGGAAPVHRVLLHREAVARNRATVLSVDSMAGFAAFGLGAPLLGLLADAAGLQTAMVTAGGIAVLGAVFYLPALRAERSRHPAEPPVAPVPQA